MALDWPVQFKKQYKGPIHVDAVKDDIPALESYISSSGVAEDGDQIYVKSEKAAYLIYDDGGTLSYKVIGSGSSSNFIGISEFQVNQTGVTQVDVSIIPSTATINSVREEDEYLTQSQYTIGGGTLTKTSEFIYDGVTPTVIRVEWADVIKSGAVLFEETSTDTVSNDTLFEQI